MGRALPVLLALAAAGVATVLLIGGNFGDSAVEEPTSVAIKSATPEPNSKGLVRARVPGLMPRFDPAISDYLVRCARRQRLRVRVAPRRGAKVRLYGAGGWRSRRIAKRIRLEPDERFDFAARPKDGGRRRTERYHVRCLPSSFPAWRYESFAPGAAALYAATPSGRAVIFGRHGVPIWWSPTTLAKNLQVMSDGTIAWGRLFTDKFGVDSQSSYQLHTPSGRPVRTMRTRGTPIDYHDARELKHGRFLLLSYAPRPEPVDLTPWDGPEDAKVVDGELQEIDRRGRVVWRWNSSDWITTGERQRRAFNRDEDYNTAAGASGAYDLIHLNSMDVRGGRILISSRFTDAVHLIDRKTGEIIWKLGGSPTPQSLDVIGDRRKQPLSAQHDARFAPGNTITVFDNRSDVRQQPRAVTYRIDEEARTATFIEHWRDNEVQESKCCGSARLLPDGSMVVGWGDSTATEFSPDREITWRLEFPGEHSYRVTPIKPGRITMARLRRGMDRRAVTQP